MESSRAPSRTAAAARTGALLVAAGTGAAWLHSLREAPWAQVPAGGLTTWLSSAPADAVAAGARIGALGLCLWLAATTTAYLMAAVLRRRGLRARLRRLTLPAVRDAIDRAVATGVAGGLLAVPGLPAPGAGPPGPGAEVPAPPPAATAPAEPAAAAVYVVRPGDSLWSIAARQAGTSDPDVVAGQWRRVVQAARGQLRSGDPDLIHPGERLTLPPLDDRD